MTEYAGPDVFVQARTALYATSGAIAVDHFPLGTGFGSFGSYASRVYYSDIYVEYGLSNLYGLSASASFFITDTFWPMVIGEGGIATMLGWLALLWVLARASWQLARSASVSASERFIGLGSLFVLVGSLSESAASNVYGASLPAALALFPAGVLWALTQQRRLHSPVPPVEPQVN
jgi:hypothetical protein